MGLDTRALLDAMFAASPDLLALTRPDGTVVRTNPAWQRLLGWTEADLLGGALAALRHPEDSATGAPVAGGRFRWRHKDGGYRWVQWQDAALEEQGLVLMAGRDVTETVAAEEAAARESERLRVALDERAELLGRANAAVQALEQERGAVMTAMHQLEHSERQFAEVFDHSPVAKIVVGLRGPDRGRILLANPAFHELLGFTREQLEDLRLWDITTRPVEELEWGLRMLADGSHSRGVRESVLIRADGSLVDALSRTSAIRDDDGPVTAVIQLLDMTAERRALAALETSEQRLTDRNRELEAANQLKLDIIGMLGHEIGNPLTTIQGNAEILAEDWTGLPETVRARVVDAIVRQASRLDEIVREVLAMVTLDSGMAEAERRALSVHDEIGQALAAAGQETVPVHGPDVRVLFQPGHLQQILVNLLSNAAKYGGGATGIRVSGTAGRVEVVVEDDGPGVPVEFRARLFERLARADRDAESVKGTGLGLYIVRGLAEANNAGIHYEPNPGGGSRFVLSIEPAEPV